MQENKLNLLYLVNKKKSNLKTEKHPFNACNILPL